jgi:hypothetical protein
MNLEDEVRYDWELVNKNCSDSLKDFFESYMCLNCDDIGSIVGMKYSDMREYKVKAGFYDPSKPHGTAEQVSISLPPEFHEIDEFEDTKEWWERNYEKYGVRQLARLTGLSSRVSVKHMLKKHGVQTKKDRKFEHKNRYNNKEILHNLYIVKDLSAQAIADMAGVSRRTIKYWLTRNGIKKKYRKTVYVAKNPSKQNPEKK